MFILYTFLYTFVFIIMSPYYLFRSLKYGEGLSGLKERFGVLPETTGDSIWIHSCSVGEVKIAVEFIKRLKSNPDIDTKIVLTTMTPTGKQTAEEEISGDIHRIYYIPLDWSFTIKKFIKRINPRALIIVETEIWPNLIKTCSEHSIPLFMINGRISKDSFPKYLLITGLLKRLFLMFEMFFMRSSSDAGRIKDLGAPEEKIRVTGNMKFDIDINIVNSTVKQLKKLKGQRNLLIAGSTLENEEEMIVENYIERNPDYMMLIAPRHPKRFDRVADLLEEFETNWTRWSENPAPADNHDIILLDTLGDLACSFSVCEAAFIGGSLVPKGGHNILEPAYFGKPVLVGKYMENFSDIAEVFRENKAIIEVDGTDKLFREVERLFENSGEREKLGERAQNLIDKHRGATDKNIESIVEHLQ